MPSVYDLKTRFQKLLRPLVGGMARAGVRPNHLTVGALVGSVAVGASVLLASHRPLWLLGLPVWLLMRMALNALDGMLAVDAVAGTRPRAAWEGVGDRKSDVEG